MKTSTSLLLRSIVVLLLALALVPLGSSAQQGQGQGPPDTGEDEAAVNSLSLPVINVTTGTATDATSVTGDAFCYVDTATSTTQCLTEYLIQGTATWSADVAYDPELLTTATVYEDWGDNIEEDQVWSDGQYIRVESALYVQLDVPMDGYVMVDLLAPETGLDPAAVSALLQAYPGVTELWAVEDQTPDGTFEPVPMTGYFDPTTGAFVYDPTVTTAYAMVALPMDPTMTLYNDGVAVYDMVLSSEINQSGKFIYGGQLDTDASEAIVYDPAASWSIDLSFTDALGNVVYQTDSITIFIGAPRGGGGTGGGGEGGPPEGGGGPPTDGGGNGQGRRAYRNRRH